MKLHDRVEVVASAEEMEPLGAVGDVMHLFGIYRLQGCECAIVARCVKDYDHPRSHVEPARFEYYGHDGEPAQQVIGRMIGGEC